MITVTFRPNKLELEVKGHAGAGEKGEDIVCSAVSALFYTLCNCLVENKQMLVEEPVITEEDGNGKVSCKPTPKFESTIKTFYYVVVNGLKLLADAYPDFIECK